MIYYTTPINDIIALDGEKRVLNSLQFSRIFGKFKHCDVNTLISAYMPIYDY
jgi:hypothetical protein